MTRGKRSLSVNLKGKLNGLWLEIKEIEANSDLGKMSPSRAIMVNALSGL